MSPIDQTFANISTEHLFWMMLVSVGFFVAMMIYTRIR